MLARIESCCSKRYRLLNWLKRHSFILFESVILIRLFRNANTSHIIFKASHKLDEKLYDYRISAMNLNTCDPRSSWRVAPHIVISAIAPRDRQHRYLVVDCGRVLKTNHKLFQTVLCTTFGAPQSSSIPSYRLKHILPHTATRGLRFSHDRESSCDTRGQYLFTSGYPSSP